MQISIAIAIAALAINTKTSSPIITTADLGISDHVFNSASCPTDAQKILEPIKAKARAKEPGLNKFSLTHTEFSELMGALEGIAKTPYAGGSSANTLRGLIALIPPAKANFITSLGVNGADNSMIRSALKKDGVNIITNDNYTEAPETAISMIFVDDEGKREIFTYAGNAKKIIKPQIITEKMIDNSTHVLLQGSLLKKLDPEVFNRAMKLRWEAKKELILALPTSAFAPNYFTGHNRNEAFFEYILPSANIVLSNVDELALIFKGKNKEQTLELFARHQIENSEALQKARLSPQIAFITDSVNGSYTVSNGEINHVKSYDILSAYNAGKIVNDLGAGDASYAGFVAGRLLGLSLEESAKLGMAMGGCNCMSEGPVMKNPIGEIAKLDKELAAKVITMVAQLQQAPTTLARSA